MESLWLTHPLEHSWITHLNPDMAYLIQHNKDGATVCHHGATSVCLTEGAKMHQQGKGGLVVIDERRGLITTFSGKVKEREEGLAAAAAAGKKSQDLRNAEDTVNSVAREAAKAANRAAKAQEHADSVSKEHKKALAALEAISAPSTKKAAKKKAAKSA